MSKVGKLDWQIFKRIIGLTRPFKYLLYSSALLAVVLAPLGVLRPYLINRMIDDHVLKNDVTGLIRMAMMYVAILLIGAILRYLFIFSTNLLGQNVIRDLRIKVFQHIASLKLRYFDQTPIGTSTTRTINDIESINSIFTQGLITMIADILGILAVLLIMFSTSWRLSIICLTTMPVMIIATYIFKEKIKSAYQKVRTQIGQMNAFLQERITGMKIIQIFNAEKQELDKFKAINQEYTNANLNSVLYYAVFFPIVEFISALSLALMIWWGARGVIAGDVSLGELVVFPLYLSMLFRPIRMLADKFNTLQMGMVAADRVFTILDNSQKIQNTGLRKIHKLKGNITFKNVYFAYDQQNFVLEDISFELPSSKTLAIVGSTGSGKTTIINILNRFYDIQRGHILVDGINIQDYELSTFRSRIAIVLQDVFLFTGTVLDNIRLRSKNISEEQIIQASKMIGAHEFIHQLPGGYNYQILERGNNLSMGQRQLISFVRALVFDPDILILDEATSSIDSETEAIIQRAIETLIDKRSSIIIAHRLSTIRHADKILVLNKGKIEEFGKQEDLLAKPDGAYRKLYDMQFIESEIR